MNPITEKPSTDTIPDACDYLLSQGWREGRDQFKTYARMFYKRYATPSRCACNDDKEGMQVCIYVCDVLDQQGYEIDVCGELPDGTWLKVSQWSMPRDIRVGLLTIKRLLATWEAASNHAG